MIQEFSETLLKELKDGLKVVSNGNYLPHIALREQLYLISESLSALQSYLEDNPFADIHSEIYYHKTIYPQFKSQQVYATESYALLYAKSLQTDHKLLRKKYLSELDYLEHFFARHHFQYEYYRLGTTQLDSIYFTSEKNRDNDLPPVLETPEVANSNTMGFLFAKFIGYERLRQDILLLLKELENPKQGFIADMENKSKPQKAMKWTGEKVNLIELVHALFLKKQVNNGKMGIHEFFELIGTCFDIDLGIPKRGFDDLKVRKRISKTNFIDSMREALLKKMEDEDAYDPKKMNFKKLGY